MSEEERTPIEELASTTMTYREALEYLRRATVADYLYVFLLIVLAVTDLAILHIPPQLIAYYIMRIPIVLPHYIMAIAPAMTYVFMFWTLGAFVLYIFYRDKLLPPIFYFLDGVITGFSSLVAFFYTGVYTLLVFTAMSMFELSYLYTEYFRRRDELKDAIFDAYQYGVRTPYTEDDLRAIGFTDEELEELLGRKFTKEGGKGEIAGTKAGEEEEGGGEG